MDFSDIMSTIRHHMLTPFVEENLVSVSLIPVTCNRKVSDNVMKRSGQAERGSIKESLGFLRFYAHIHRN